jgi:guanylate kinase
LTPDTTQHRHRRGILFVISGPSGVGKTSLCQRVVAEMRDVTQSVSYTTRAPRPEERHGHEYYFISRQAFEQRIGAGEFVEWAQVHGDWYGTSRQQIEAVIYTGVDVLLAIDVQGALQLRSSDVDAVFVFLIPPSWEALTARLQQRGSETPKVQKRRLAVACEELAHYTEYDYVVSNDQFPTAAEVLKAIVIAERHQESRVGPEPVEELLAHDPASEMSWPKGKS